MIDTTNITRLRLKKDKEIDAYNQENREAYGKLGYFKRNKLIKTKELIFDITSAIEKESGWVYTPSLFECYSDYSYTGKEITFTVNSISTDSNGYHLSDNPTEREIEFFERYHEMLERLFGLEQRRKELIPPISPNVIPFSSIQTREERIRENKGNILANNFINTFSFEFVSEYKSKGVTELVRLLNLLTDSKDIMATYRSLYRGSGIYEQELLRFVGLYTPRGQQVLDELAREKLEKQYMLSGFPSYEDRMTKNMIDLHL